MDPSTLMRLNVIVPFKIAMEKSEISSITVETSRGSFGILPRRQDCVAALAPGILTYRTDGQKELYLAVDEGVLVKTGLAVTISVRNAISGSDLTQLRVAVDREFFIRNDEEKKSGLIMDKMEGDFIRQLVEFRHE